MIENEEIAAIEAERNQLRMVVCDLQSDLRNARQMVNQKRKQLDETSRLVLKLMKERDRIVAGCRATADWLDDLLPRGDWIEIVNYSDGVRAKVAELRRMFLPRERFGDNDSIADRYGPEGD